MFPTQFTKREKIFSNPGDRFAPTYKSKVMRDGSIELVQAGKIDVYEKIQSYREECDLHCIIKKYELTGDEKLLNKYQGVFGDFSEAPACLAEYYQRIFDAKDFFNQLPVSVKAEFNHSPEQFFASIGSEKFNKLFSVSPAAAQEEQQPPAVEKGDAE